MEKLRILLLAAALVVPAALLTAACSSDEKEADTESAPADTDQDGGDEDGGDVDSETETVVELPFVTYDADDERFLYTGRIDFTDPKEPEFSTGGTYIKFNFTGVALNVLMDFGKLYGYQKAFMDVVIDGERTILEPSAEADGKYEVASGLENTEHEVVLARRSQSLCSYSKFLGVEVGGELLDPPTRPERKIQIIGDSIAAGEGSDVESSSECEDNWDKNLQFADTYLTFGPMLAETLDAEFHVLAWSGKGLMWNYENDTEDSVMPILYERMFMEDEDSAVWDHSLYVPDAILIELGTNDYGGGNDSSYDDVEGARRPSPDQEEWVAAYVEFVDTLLGYYPDAEIFALASVLLSDGWPESDTTRDSDMRAALTALEDYYADQGNDQVHAIMTTHVNARGCSYHPNASQHADMAAELVDPVKEVMGW